MVGQILHAITFLSFLCLSVVNSVAITKCKSDDSKCSKASTQALIPVFVNGLPEYNVKKMDPISFDRIDASTSNLKFILTDVTMTGIKDCMAKKVKRDKSKNKLFVKVMCNLQAHSQYEMEGQLLFIKLHGKGRVHVTIRKVEISMDADMGEIEKDGVAYWDVKDWRHSFALKDKSDVVFDNLFEGNEVLAQAAREVISNSGNDIILEVGPKIIKTIIEEVVTNVQNFFHAVPAKELTID